MSNMIINHILPHESKSEVEVLSINYAELIGEDLALELSTYLHSNMHSAFMGFLKNLYVTASKVYPKKPEDVFTSFRDYSKILNNGDEPKIVIFDNEVVPHHLSTGRAFSMYKHMVGIEKSTKMKMFLESVAKYYGMKFEDYVSAFETNHEISLEAYADEGILTIPLSPISSSVVSYAYHRNTLTMMYKMLEVMVLNSTDTVFVLTDPFQEVIEPLLQRHKFSVIKSYELEDPSSFIDIAVSQYLKNVNNGEFKGEGRYSIMF